MTIHNDPAFARVAASQNGYPIGSQVGLTKREYFAALAMIGLLSQSPEICVRDAVKYADELIKALNK